MYAKFNDNDDDKDNDNDNDIDNNNDNDGTNDEQCASILRCPSFRGAPRRQNQQGGCMHYQKLAMTIEISCKWVTNREKKKEEKNHEIQTALLGIKANVRRISSETIYREGWCQDSQVELKELVGSKSKGVLHNLQKAVISGTLNISRTFKVATWTMNIALHLLISFLQFF